MYTRRKRDGLDVSLEITLLAEFSSKTLLVYVEDPLLAYVEDDKDRNI
jgi:hypothetical protein